MSRNSQMINLNVRNYLYSKKSGIKKITFHLTNSTHPKTALATPVVLLLLGVSYNEEAAECNRFFNPLLEK